MARDIRYPGTLLPADATMEENRKAVLDLLTKINEVFSTTSDEATALQQAIDAINSARRAVVQPLTAKIAASITFTLPIKTVGQQTIFIPAALLTASSGGPFTLTITTGAGGSSTVLVPVSASGDTIASGPLLFDIYVDSSGNVSSKDWTLSGSNANGTYSKFSDGTMDQWGISATVTTSNGGPWTTSPFYALVSVTLPTSFVNATFNVASSVFLVSATFQFMGYVQSQSASGFAQYIFNNQSAQAAFFWIAKGQWK